MTIKLVLASPNDSTAEHITQVLAEADSISLMQVVREASDVSDALERSPDTDILVVDARLDGGRGLAVARSIASASPLLGIVMLVDQAGPEQFAAAMESGARSVISSASSLAEIVSRLESVAQWVTAARSAVGSDSTLGRGGRVIAVAGAKGGVGTSAVALLLAQSLLGTRTVGLVDFDLQSGDLAAYLGVHTRRSVVDLVDIAGEMSGRILRETSYDVPGGLRLLSAPNDGEREEEMTAPRRPGGGQRAAVPVRRLDRRRRLAPHRGDRQRARGGRPRRCSSSLPTCPHCAPRAGRWRCGSGSWSGRGPACRSCSTGRTAAAR